MSAHTAKNKRTIRTDLPTPVWDRLADEAAALGIPVGRHLHNLIVARDKRRQERTAKEE